MDDQFASVVIGVCLNNKWRVPEDFAVVGTGNIELSCECSHVPISSVDLGDDQVALEAAKLLDRLMYGQKVPAAPIVIAPHGLVIRASSNFLALENAYLSQAVRFIDTNLRSPFSMEQLADSINVSRRTLYNLFQLHFKCSPVQFILHARFDRARQLMGITPDQTVDHLVTQCGFGSSRTFSRMLLKYEGTDFPTWKSKFRRTSYNYALSGRQRRLTSKSTGLP
jgi:LacI family transcriptional regulator